MELLSSKCVFIFLWHVSFFLLFPVLLGIDVTSNSIYIDNRNIDDNGDIQDTYISENGNNIDRHNDVIDNSRGDTFTRNTASEKFLESLQQKCKKYKSIKLICNSLRLVLPITRPNQPIPASEETNRNSPLENTGLEKRFTQPSDLTETETYIVRPEKHEATTDIPMKSSYVYLQNHKRSSVTTNKDKMHDIIPTEPNRPHAPSHMVPNLAYQNRMMTHNFEANVFRKNDNSDAYSHITESEEKYGTKKSDVAHNLTYQTEFVTDNSAENVFTEGNRSEESAYSELTGSDVEDENDAREPDKSSNMAYQNHIITDNSEDVFRKMDRSEQTAYSDDVEINEFTTPYTDTNPDYDEKNEREQDVGYEMEDEDTRNCLREDKDKMESNDKVICSVAKSNAENVSDKAGEEGDGGKLDNMMDRFIDDSVKIFKNSFTIKFPTFERITNKLFEWFQIVFGTKSRDEGKIINLLNIKRIIKMNLKLISSVLS
jgi:hypothetical protein